ncbi:hypothetical protein ElyMa_005495400 [Elysia marginata]|uniref:Uncharacterized protein n=1 Tax=Elysia marginata TaxID=1093978 RepID=A0AAV4ET70_9GAST|nr:hypothetical protein ElyMa_005495400 [Elysia marginata]
MRTVNTKLMIPRERRHFLRYPSNQTSKETSHQHNYDPQSQTELFDTPRRGAAADAVEPETPTPDRSRRHSFSQPIWMKDYVFSKIMIVFII